jgi:hypothetical protein
MCSTCASTSLSIATPSTSQFPALYSAGPAGLADCIQPAPARFSAPDCLDSIACASSVPEAYSPAEIAGRIAMQQHGHKGGGVVPRREHRRFQHLLILLAPRTLDCREPQKPLALALTLTLCSHCCTQIPAGIGPAAATVIASCVAGASLTDASRCCVTARITAAFSCCASSGLAASRLSSCTHALAAVNGGNGCSCFSTASGGFSSVVYLGP